MKRHAGSDTEVKSVTKDSEHDDKIEENPHLRMRFIHVLDVRRFHETNPVTCGTISVI